MIRTKTLPNTIPQYGNQMTVKSRTLKRARIDLESAYNLVKDFPHLQAYIDKALVEVHQQFCIEDENEMRFI